MYKINTKLLIKDLGGIAATKNKLSGVGVYITAKGIAKWIERNSISLSNLFSLWEATKKYTGKPLDFNTYLVKE
jgi:hypothetical protein